MTETIQVDFSKLFRFLDDYEQSLVNNPSAWRAMSVPYYKMVSRIFRAQGQPKWPELAESTIARRRKGKGKGGRKVQIGVDTGMMRASSTGPAARGSVMSFGNNFLLIGTALKYAKWFQLGTTVRGRPHQPARPFFQEPDSATMSEMLRAFLHIARRK